MPWPLVQACSRRCRYLRPRGRVRVGLGDPSRHAEHPAAAKRHLEQPTERELSAWHCANSAVSQMLLRLLSDVSRLPQHRTLQHRRTHGARGCGRQGAGSCASVTKLSRRHCRAAGRWRRCCAWRSAAAAEQNVVSVRFVGASADDARLIVRLCCANRRPARRVRFTLGLIPLGQRRRVGRVGHVGRPASEVCSESAEFALSEIKKHLGRETAIVKIVLR